MDTLYNIIGKATTLPPFKTSAEAAKTLRAVFKLGDKRKYAPYLGQLYNAIKQLDVKEAYERYEELEREEKLDLVMNRILYLVKRKEENNIFATDFLEKEFNTEKEFRAFQKLIREKKEFKQREVNRFQDEVDAHTKDINTLYADLLRKLGLESPYEMMTGKDIVHGVEDLIAIENVNINMLNLFRDKLRKIQHYENLVQENESSFDELSGIEQLLNTLSTDKRTVDMIGAVFTNDVDFYSIVMEEVEPTEKEVEMLIGFANYMKTNEEIVNDLVKRIDLSRLGDEDLKFVLRSGVEGIDYTKKIRGKFLFEYLDETSLQELEQLDANIMKMKEIVLKSIQCRNETDPITQDRFDEMTLKELTRVIHLNGNCYILDGIREWIKKSDKDPLLGIPLTREKIREINNL